jgi:hypothetical protein
VSLDDEIARGEVGPRPADVPLDTNVIRYRHLRPEVMENRTFYAGHVVIDLAACIEEIGRLRAALAEAEEESHQLRLMAEDAAHAENLNALDAQKERAAVVAWLRAQAEMAYDNTDAHHALWLAAEDIERGEHRREEK